MTHTARSAGAALLTAMLTVSLVATLAAAMLSLQTQQIERETAERQRSRRDWIMHSTMHWLGQALRKQAALHNGGGQEPNAASQTQAVQNLVLPDDLWLVQTGAAAPDDTGPALVSAQILDAQARLNVRNLIRRARVFEPELENFEILFERLGLPQSELKALAAQMAAAQQGTSSPTPLPPQQLDHLLAFGLSPGTLSQLRPYISLLPAQSTLNLNTASADVLSVAVPNLSVADAQKAIAARGDKPWTDLSAALVALGLQERLEEALGWDAYSLKSDYFELKVQLREAGTEYTEVRLIHHLVGSSVRVLQRTSSSTPLLGATSPLSR